MFSFAFTNTQIEACTRYVQGLTVFLSTQSLQYLTTNLTFKWSYLHLCTYHNAPVTQRTVSQPQHLQNQKSIPKSCATSPWHISDRLECWLMSSQCLMCKTLDFKQFKPNPTQLYWLLTLHISVENDPVSGSRSNRIMQFRTGPGLDWILKKLNRIRYGYPNCIDHCSKFLNQSFFWI